MEKTNFEQNDKLSKIFSVVGSTENFVSIIENATLGWFGTQFHPEKAQFEFGRSGLFYYLLLLYYYLLIITYYYFWLKQASDHKSLLLKNINSIGILHSPETIQLGFESARFFVEEAKKNMHRLLNKDLLIYNFNTVYTGKKVNYSFEEVYYFEK